MVPVLISNVYFYSLINATVLTQGKSINENDDDDDYDNDFKIVGRELFRVTVPLVP
jgi:hypothetical protein